MQQGKMFFFMGTIMAVVHGGYVRRIKAGSEVKVAQMVRFPTSDLPKFSTLAGFCDQDISPR